MSFDLVIYNPKKAPRGEKGFFKWYKDQIDSEESEMYDDISFASADLQRWYYQMIEIFPPVNGPDAPSAEEILTMRDETHLTEYFINKNMIYCIFSDSLSEVAYLSTCRYAADFGLGLFSPKDNGRKVFKRHRCLTKGEAIRRSLLFASKVTGIVVALLLLFLLIYFRMDEGAEKPREGFSAETVIPMILVPLILLAASALAYYNEHYALYKLRESYQEFQQKVFDALPSLKWIMYSRDSKLSVMSNFFYKGRTYHIESVSRKDGKILYTDTNFVVLKLVSDKKIPATKLAGKHMLGELSSSIASGDLACKATCEWKNYELILTMKQKDVTPEAVAGLMCRLAALADKYDLPSNELFLKYNDSTCGACCYIHFHNNVAIRQIEKYSEEDVAWYSENKQPEKLFDLPYEEFHYESEQIGIEEFEALWCKYADAEE